MTVQQLGEWLMNQPGDLEVVIEMVRADKYEGDYRPDPKIREENGRKVVTL